MAPTPVFVCAARQDADLRDELFSHLAPLVQQGWIHILKETDIELGQSVSEQRRARVRHAQLVLLLLSPSLLAGLGENEAVHEALDRHARSELVLVPIVLRACDWEAYSFGKLASLPRNGKPLVEHSTSTGGRDSAWVQIVRELRPLIERLSKQSAAVHPAPPPPVQPTGTAAQSDAGPSGSGQPKAGAHFVRGHALLIGTGQPGIEVTARDAQALHAVLTHPGRAGYPLAQATLLAGNKATRSAILSALSDLVQRVNADPGATVLIYFSGHGLRLDASPPSYYLIPWDYSIGNESTTAISGSEFSDLIGQIKSRKLMVFLDCCHAAGVPKDPKIHTAAFPRELERKLGHGSGLVIVASSRDDEVSWTSSPYSLFTNCLLEALDGQGSSDEYARVLNVITYLMQEVPKRQHNQHPVVRRMQDLDDNFAICFHGAPANPTKQPPHEPQRVGSEPHIAGPPAAISMQHSTADSRLAKPSEPPQTGTPPMPTTPSRPAATQGRTPTRPTIRRALQGAIENAGDLDAFCHDYFPAIYQRFSNGMDRTSRLNLLLQLADRREILKHLRAEYPTFDYDAVLEWEP